MMADDEPYPAADHPENGLRLDPEILMEAASGDVSEAAELGDLFFRMAEDQFAELQRAAAQGDTETIRRVAHRAAGGAATCGLTRLAECFRALETAAADKQSGWPERLAAADKECAASREAFASFIGKAVFP